MKRRKVSTCARCGSVGHNARNRCCPSYVDATPISRVLIETLADQISSIGNAQGNDDSDDEDNDDNEALPEDEVLDDIDVEEGVAYEDRSNDFWTLTDFEDPDVIPQFDGEWGANRAKMRETNCTNCLDSFACYFDDEIVNTFVAATQSFGSRDFGSLWKQLDVNEFKSFLAIILVLGLVPVTSRDYAWGGDRLVKSLMTKASKNTMRNEYIGQE